MENILIYISIAFASGIVFQKYFDLSYNLTLILPLIFLLFSIFQKQKKLFSIGISIVFFTLGILAYASSLNFSSRHISKFEMPRKTSVIGTVCSPVETRNTKRGSAFFNVKITKVRGIDSKGLGRWLFSEGKLRVNVFNVGANDSLPINYGDEVRLWGELSLPKEPVDKSLFNYRKYLFNNNIDAVMTCYNSSGVTLYSHETQSITAKFLRVIYAFRERIKNIIESVFDFPCSAIMKALLIGDRSGIPTDIKNAFVKTGTIHVLAISGLHVSIIAGVFYWFIARVSHVRLLRVIFVLLFMWLYVFISGGRYPVMRSAIMGTFVLIALVLDRKKSSIHLISIAFLIILVFNPRSIFLVGFQLSFITVLSIVVLVPFLQNYILFWTNEITHYGWKEKLKKYCLDSMLVYIAVVLGASPLMMYYFNLFSLTGFVANIFVLPLITFSIVSGMLCILCFMLSESLSVLSFFPQLSLNAAIKFIKFFGSISNGFLTVKTFPVSLVIIYYVAFLFFMLKRKYFGGKRIVIILGLIWFLFLSMSQVRALFTCDTLTFLYEGRSFSAVLQSGKNVSLFNVGTSAHVKNKVLPLLKKNGVENIQDIFCLSGYKSAFGGIKKVQESFEVENFYRPYGTFKFFYRDYPGIKNEFYVGDNFVCAGENKVEILNVPEDYVETCSESGSVVLLKVKDADVIMGDVSALIEAKLKGRLKKADILFVSNNEKLSAKFQEVIEYIKPKEVIFQKEIETDFVKQIEKEVEEVFLDENILIKKFFKQENLLF